MIYVFQVQIDPAYQPRELLHALAKVEAKALICAEQYKSSNCYETVQTLIPELNSSAEGGIEISSSKLPALKTLIVMSNKQYRSVPLDIACIVVMFQCM
jgi:fatty-acyl-CoA synthase